MACDHSFFQLAEIPDHVALYELVTLECVDVDALKRHRTVARLVPLGTFLTANSYASPPIFQASEAKTRLRRHSSDAAIERPSSSARVCMARTCTPR